jgi:hypothetical protein
VFKGSFTSQFDKYKSNALDIPAESSVARAQVDSRNCPDARSSLERHRLAQHLELFSVDLELIASSVARWATNELHSRLLAVQADPDEGLNADCRC